VLSSPAAILSASHIAALHIDNQRRLWIGYFDRGIDILSPNRSSIAHLENDVLFCVNRIKQEQPSGRVFVGTANGLAVFDSGAKLQEILTKTSGLIANHVTDVLFRRTAEGALSTVVATTAGLTFMEGANISSVYAFEGLVNNHVYTVAQVGDVLLAGTLGGVSLLKGDAVQANFTTANSGLRQNWITASTNFAGEMYLGTYGSGVIRFSQRGGVETFREFSGKRIEISPNALYSTQQALYAGTAGQGLAILSKNDGRWRFVEEGLPSRTVTAIDGDGDNLYVGTDNGLVTVPERELLP
jgi:ligand-binding sensor domain-containing protein